MAIKIDGGKLSRYGNPMKEPAMNGYKAFYNSKSIELYAESLFAAKEKAVAVFKPPKSKRHMVSVVLCEKGGEVVVHNPAEF